MQHSAPTAQTSEILAWANRIAEHANSITAHQPGSLKPKIWLRLQEIPIDTSLLEGVKDLACRLWTRDLDTNKCVSLCALAQMVMQEGHKRFILVRANAALRLVGIRSCIILHLRCL
jgi:hypothetical protein